MHNKNVKYKLVEFKNALDSAQKTLFMKNEYKRNSCIGK